jgi:hypothetical protein
MAAMHAVEIAYGQRASGGNVGMVKSTKNFHRSDIFLIAVQAVTESNVSEFDIKTGYIVAQWWGE